jgi:adenylosuccinate lyase
LVDKGLKREDSYQIVQGLAMKSRAIGKNLKTIAMEDPQIAKKLTYKEIEEIFNIRYYLRNIKTIFDRLDL